jgi:aspartate aminotransferase
MSPLEFTSTLGHHRAAATKPSSRLPDTEHHDLSKRARTLPPAAIIRMAQRARDLAAQGHKIINLTVGQPDFDTPEHIKQAAKEALDKGLTKYTPVPGTPALRQAIADKFRSENGIDTTPEQIVVSNGAKQSIVNVCLALLDPGDEVIVTAPYWTSYLGLIALAGAKPVIVPASVEEDYKAPAERLESAITDKTRLVIMNSPSNPTGAVYTQTELEAHAAMLARHERVHVICDEIYEYINFTGSHASLGSLPEIAERTITVNGFSKGFAMTGWRLGYLTAPRWIAEACTKIQSNVTSGASSFAQYAAIRALEGPRDEVDAMAASYRKRRDYVILRLKSMDNVLVSVPDGSFYVFPDIGPYLETVKHDGPAPAADGFCETLLERHHLACVSGTAFGAATSLRLSFAASMAELEHGLDKLALALGGKSSTG